MLNYMYHHSNNKHLEIKNIQNASIFYPPSTNTNLQPDITIIVGHSENMVKFLAHKWILANHSGYFKALFSSYDGYETQISSISSFTFAYLLTFMYTGQLDLNTFNVYEIFLASNLLHMTDVLNRCKRYLGENRNYSLSIVKPIPQKKFATPSAYETIQTLKYQPLRIHDESSSSIFKPVRPATMKYNCKTDENENERENGIHKKNFTNEVSSSDTNTTKLETPSLFSSSNVIFDVACCDGPIKFHKVTNQYYNPEKVITTKKNDFTNVSISYQGCKHVFKDYHSECKYSPLLNDDHFASRTIHSTEMFKTKTTLVRDMKLKKKDPLQYYTCKTCGSKFPSYYFVHKHRKLHHQERKEI
ncbi:hypothetical protein PGB90_005910 [Kerria lacca]